MSTMAIGVPKEIKQKEHRVALLPPAAWQLVQRGQRVLVERGAGAGAGYDDAEYLNAGVRYVGVLDPDRRTLHLDSDAEPPRNLGAEDELALPDLLGDFRVVVGRFFE